jgi:hypothetical protein
MESLSLLHPDRPNVRRRIQSISESAIETRFPVYLIAFDKGAGDHLSVCSLDLVQRDPVIRPHGRFVLLDKKLSRNVSDRDVKTERTRRKSTDRPSTYPSRQVVVSGTRASPSADRPSSAPRGDSPRVGRSSSGRRARDGASALCRRAGPQRGEGAERDVGAVEGIAYGGVAERRQLNVALVEVHRLQVGAGGGMAAEFRGAGGKVA